MYQEYIEVDVSKMGTVHIGPPWTEKTPTGFIYKHRTTEYDFYGNLTRDKVVDGIEVEIEVPHRSKGLFARYFG